MTCPATAWPRSGPGCRRLLAKGPVIRLARPAAAVTVVGCSRRRLASASSCSLRRLTATGTWSARYSPPRPALSTSTWRWASASCFWRAWLSCTPSSKRARASSRPRLPDSKLLHQGLQAVEAIIEGGLGAHGAIQGKGPREEPHPVYRKVNACPSRRPSSPCRRPSSCSRQAGPRWLRAATRWRRPWLRW